MLPIHHELILPLSPAQVLNTLAVEGYQQAKNRLAGALSNSAAVTAQDGILRIRNTRIHDRTLIPGQARSFAPDPLQIVEDQQWEFPGPDDADPHGETSQRTGKVRVTVPGTPVRFDATVILRPHPDGSVLVADGSISADVPLFGSAVERAIQPVVIAALDIEREALAQWQVAE